MSHPNTEEILREIRDELHTIADALMARNVPVPAPVPVAMPVPKCTCPGCPGPCLRQQADR